MTAEKKWHKTGKRLVKAASAALTLAKAKPSTRDEAKQLERLEANLNAASADHREATKSWIAELAAEETAGRLRMVA